MTQIPPHQSLIQYYQLRNSLIVLLNELADLAQQRSLSIVVDEWIDGRIPKSYIASNTDAFHQLSLRAIIDEDIRQTYKPFRVAVVGEFTRGKTTLLNALLEQKILTSDRRPNTATCTILKYGKIPHIRVRYFDSTGLEALDINTQNLAADLVSYTSDAGIDDEQYEARLQGDEKSLADQIEGVHVWLPAKFLGQRGYELIDTPGLGSIFDSHQVITYNAIPQMDAVLFLTQFNALIGEGELVFLGSLREYVNRFLFVLTKVDLAQKEENPHEAINKAIDFTRSVLTNQVQLPNPPIYPISGVAAAQDNHYHKSGIIQLVEALDQFISCSSGRERLLKLYRSANTYHIWVEKDIQRELEELNHQIAQLAEAEDQLKSKIDDIELFRGDLNLLLKSQTEELEKRMLDGIDRLQERLKLIVTEIPINLQTKADEVVHLWLKEQEAVFRHDVQLLENSTKFFLSKILFWAARSTLTLIPEDLLLLDVMTKEINLSTTLVSLTNVAKFLSDHIKREFLASQLPPNQNLVTDKATQLNVRNQAESLFRECVESLYIYLEAMINRLVGYYLQLIKQQTQLIDEQRNKFQQSLNLISQQNYSINNIRQQLESIKLYLNINPKI
ncbi:MAG: dynamin family protein [Cyanobacteria bacterium P01_A01_bin.80]